MKTRLSVSVLAAMLLPVLSTFIAAQPLCPSLFPLDDGFAVGCCLPPAPSLPVPPPITMTASWGAFSGCTLGMTATATVTIGSPNWVLCDVGLIPITISGLPGVPTVTTFLVGKYVRTWMEPDASGAPRNVWRILVNGDIFFSASTACPTGSCLPPSSGAPWFLPAHFVGHIDYACDSAASGNYLASFSLSHLPGCVMHAPYSTRPIPALAASDATYHLVGPAPFTFTAMPEPQGALTGDGARASTLFTSPLFYQCHGETDRFFGGILATVNADCFCSSLPNGPWRHQTLVADIECGGQVQVFNSVPVGGTPFAQTGFAALTLGHWNNGGAFPQTRSLVVYLGVMTSSSFTCSPVLNPFNVVTGVGTTSSIPGQLFSVAGAVPPLPASSFMDLQNMLPISLWTAAGGVGTPGIGSLFVSDQVLSLNTP